MQINQILSAPLIDIIFDGHNKNYGAYELRKNYSKRINRALIITMTVAGLISGSVILANSSKKSTRNYRMGPVVELTPLPDKKIEDPKPEKKQEIKPVKTVIYTAPVIKETVENPPPVNEDLDKVKIGTEKIDSGDIYTGIPGPKEIDNGKGIITPKAETGSDEPFTSVEIEAKYPGNWKAFLERNLEANTPIDHSAPYGRYSVVVQFVVDKEGNVSDIQALTNHGYGMEEEAIRVLKKATKWEPAIQNGIKVKAYRKQVIVFVVEEEG